MTVKPGQWYEIAPWQIVKVIRQDDISGHWECKIKGDGPRRRVWYTSEFLQLHKRREDLEQ
jgi:hypothetical protein